MPNRPVFILPEGLKLTATEETLDLEFDGNVELASSLGRAFNTITVTGDLTIKLPNALTGVVRCGGTLTVVGDIDAESLHANEIVLGRQNIKCRSLSAQSKLTLGAATIVADVVIAPELQIDPKAQGRVTVIESGNERGANKIKGGFGLADYEDMFGNSEEFLAQRGLRRLDAGGPLAEGARPKAVPARPKPVAPPPDEATQRITKPPKPGARPEVKPPPNLDEDTEDPVSVSFDDLEPLEPPAGSDDGAPRGDVHQRLLEAVGRITTCYEGTELPPAVNELQELVRSKDYDALRQNITEVWNGLLGFHQKRGIRPHHQVTHAFNVINNLVQQ